MAKKIQLLARFSSVEYKPKKVSIAGPLPEMSVGGKAKGHGLTPLVGA